MSDMQREALAALDEVWALSPDVRLGQGPRRKESRLYRGR